DGGQRGSASVGGAVNLGESAAQRRAVGEPGIGGDGGAPDELIPAGAKISAGPAGSGLGNGDDLGSVTEKDINDKDKRRKILHAQHLVPPSEEFDNDTDLTRFIKDTQSGLKKTNEYLNFISKQMARLKTKASRMGFDRVKKATQAVEK